MSFGGLTARKWLLANSENWRDWTGGESSSRIERARRMARGLVSLTRSATRDSAQAKAIATALPATLGNCDELAFVSFAETVAYSIWHLVDRYARLMQVFDELLISGDLPLRQTRFTALEIGAGPMPALHAIRDFYADVQLWAHSLDRESQVVPATHPFPLDRGQAWPTFIHAYSEELMQLGDRVGPHVFDTAFSDFEEFSVRAEHRRSIERSTQRLLSEADYWDEYLSLGAARSLASASPVSPPSGVDMIVVCNFLTERSMTKRFADELALLPRSLSPGGVLILIGSVDAKYDEIFDDFAALVERSAGVRRLATPERFETHPDVRLRELISGQLVDCVLEVKQSAPAAFESVRSRLSPDVRCPGEREIWFPPFRVAAYRNEPHLRRRQ